MSGTLTLPTAVQAGAIPSPGLQQWIQRASAVLMAMPQHQRAAYTRWALETAVRASRELGDNPARWNSLPVSPPSPSTPPVLTAMSPVQHTSGDRRKQLLEACHERVAHMYASNPMARARAHNAVELEVGRLAIGGAHLLDTVGSEDVLQRILHPHAVPPIPPSLAAHVVPALISPTIQPFAKTAAAVVAVGSFNNSYPLRRPRSPTASSTMHTLDQYRRPPQPTSAMSVSVIPRLLNPETLRRRMALFFHNNNDNATVGGSSSLRVVGTSLELERRYTREEPNPDTLRPRPVLPAALQHVLHKAEAMSRGETLDASSSSAKVVLGRSQNPVWDAARWLSDQLKGMRQDVQVQRLADPFVVALYERHARLCLALGDTLEFNQCQAALQRFYRRRDLRSAPPTELDPAADTTITDDNDTTSKARVPPSRKAPPKKSKARSRPKDATTDIAPPTTNTANLFSLTCGCYGDEAVEEFAACRLIYLSLNSLYDASARELQYMTEAAAASSTSTNNTNNTNNTTITPQSNGHLPATVQWALTLAAAIEARDGYRVSAAVAQLTDDPALSRSIGPSAAGLLAPSLQRLRTQWLFTALQRGGGLRSSLPSRAVERWLGFPRLDQWCARYVIGNVLIGPGSPDAASAWAGLWSTLRLERYPDLSRPNLDDDNAGTTNNVDDTFDAATLSAKVLDYCAFLSSSSGGT